MKKYFIWSIAAFSLLFTAHAQERPQFTQYLYNPANVNAAYVGTLEGFTFTGGYRSQWTGIDEAPNSLSFMAEQRLSEQIGLGLSVVNDDFGPTSNTDISAHFAYAVPLNDRIKMRFSLSASGNFFALDTDELTIADQEVFFTDLDNSFSPNVGVGFLIHDDRWFFGLSAPTLLSATDDDIAPGFRTRSSVFNVMGGYHIPLSEDWALRPSFLLQQITDSPFLYNLTTQVTFKDRFHFGVNYRNDKAISGLAGIAITPNIGLGYSYDYYTDALGDIANGAHEIYIRFKLSPTTTNTFIGRN